MNDEAAQPTTVRALVLMAALVIVVAGMRAAAEIVVPFLLALFVVIICTPAYAKLRSWRVPSVAALALMTAAVVLGLGGATLVVGSSVEDFSSNLPTYQELLKQKVQALTTWLETRHVHAPDRVFAETLNPKAAIGFVGGLLGGVSGLLGKAFLIILTVVFLLLEVAGIPDKIRAMPGITDTRMSELESILNNVRHYMAIKTLTSAATGALVAGSMAIIGVSYPIMWGMFAFLLNFVPNIGSILAAIPAVLLALLEHGVGTAVWTAVAFLVINTVIGSIIEPRVMGRGLGLSTLVVFLSLVFWGWVLGPVGMLLSVPLTMAVKIVLESNIGTRWLAILLGSGPPPQPAP